MASPSPKEEGWWNGLIDVVDAGLQKHYEDLNKPYKQGQFKQWAQVLNQKYYVYKYLLLA